MTASRNIQKPRKDTESDPRLTDGAWLPTGPSNTLRWTPGATPPDWQDNTPTLCGSLSGLAAHRRLDETPCNLCRAASADYQRARAQDKADARRAAA